MPPVRDTVAAPDSSGGRFFAIPFDAIAGFEEVAETARSLATLPVGLDLDRFSRADEDSAIGRGRRRLLAPPDDAGLSARRRAVRPGRPLPRRSPPRRPDRTGSEAPMSATRPMPEAIADAGMQVPRMIGPSRQATSSRVEYSTMVVSGAPGAARSPRPDKPIPQAAPLPMLHRLAVVYLMLPVLVWLVGWFDGWLGIPAAALLVGALRRPLSGRWRLRAPTPAEAAVLAVAALWVLATSAGGVFHPRNLDFFEQRVALLDLGHHLWPTYLPDPLAAWRPAPAEGPPATPPLLRYYLGWHMVPGLAARWLGPAALGWAVPLWTWAGVALVALLFTHRHGGCRRGRALVIALAVLVFFSGMSLVNAAIVGSVFEGWKWWTDRLAGVEDWYGPLLYESRFLWIWSGTHTLKLAPHHFLAAGLYALLCLHLRRQPRFLAVLGVLLAAAPFWSAFVAVGLLPLLAVVFWMNGVRPFLRWPNLCLAGPLFGVVVLYLTSGAMDFPHGWMWQREGYDWPRLLRRLPLFYLTEFLLLAVLLAAVRPAVRREPFFIAAVATLLLLPVYWYGPGNDLLLRGSLPALLVLGWLCAGAVARGGGALVRRGGLRRRAAFAGLVLVLGVGALNPAAHLVVSFQQYGPFRYEHAGYTTLVDLPSEWQRQNVARDAPGLLRRLLREPAPFPERRIPNEPVIQSGFDVYLDDGKLIYVKDRCTPKDAKKFIFVQVVPVSPEDLPADRRRQGFRYDQLFSAQPERFGDRCLFGISLPTYPVARIVTGQREWRLEEGRWVRRLLWQAEAALGAGG